MSVEKFLYLFIDLASFLVPFLFSFNPKSNFSKKWRQLLPAILLPALIFTLWDHCFASMGVWGFNARYLTGIYIYQLPLEEILFFICIPYACVFTYEVVNYYRKSEPIANNGQRVTWILIAGLLAIGIKNYDRWYTVVTFIASGLLLVFLEMRIRPTYLGRFYFAYIFMLIPFFIINGVLTGTGLSEPVVWYNDSENLGIRMGTIPIEDIFFGMLLVLMNVSIFEYLQKRSTPTS